uniref:Transthyretin-like family protein n=1 Tax=Steinernema glaseri TaxID=37863 RepID=A0A1I7YE46_9BILA
MRRMWATSALLLVSLLHLAQAGHKCVWVHGRVKCNKDPSKETNVEVRVYDRDSFSFMKIIDPDDLMGVSFSNEDGTFQLDGCGDDFDWIPGVVNDPEPYIQILHYCNNEKGELMVLPEFTVFVPNTYEVGTIELDAPEVPLPPLRSPSNSTVRGARRP